MDPDLPEMIEDLVQADPVVLFIDSRTQDPATDRMLRLLDDLSVKYQIFDLFPFPLERSLLANSLGQDAMPLLFVDAHTIGDTILVEDLLLSGTLLEIFDATGVSYDRTAALLRVKP